MKIINKKGNKSQKFEKNSGNGTEKILYFPENFPKLSFIFEVIWCQQSIFFQNSANIELNLNFSMKTTQFLLVTKKLLLLTIPRQFTRNRDHSRGRGHYRVFWNRWQGSGLFGRDFFVNMIFILFYGLIRRSCQWSVRRWSNSSYSCFGLYYCHEAGYSIFIQSGIFIGFGTWWIWKKPKIILVKVCFKI